MEKRGTVLAGMLGSLYAVLVVSLAPFSFLPIQVRFADALIPLSVVYGWPAIVGLTVGCAVSNLVAGQAFYGGWTAIDVVGGSLANFLSTYVGWKMSRGRGKKILLPVTLIQSAIVSLIVGTYLWYIFGSPEYYNVYSMVLPGLAAFWLAIFLGSLVSIVILGNILLAAILRSRLFLGHGSQDPATPRT